MISISFKVVNEDILKPLQNQITHMIAYWKWRGCSWWRSIADIYSIAFF